MDPQEYTGVMKWYNPNKGFGFVDTKDKELGDIFIHAEVWKKAGREAPPNHTPVTVVAIKVGKVLRATKVVHVG